MCSLTAKVKMKVNFTFFFHPRFRTWLLVSAFHTSFTSSYSKQQTFSIFSPLPCNRFLPVLSSHAADSLLFFPANASTSSLSSFSPTSLPPLATSSIVSQALIFVTVVFVIVVDCLNLYGSLCTAQPRGRHFAYWRVFMPFVYTSNHRLRDDAKHLSLFSFYPPIFIPFLLISSTCFVFIICLFIHVFNLKIIFSNMEVGIV